jgi:hypothetical protein
MGLTGVVQLHARESHGSLKNGTAQIPHKGTKLDFFQNFAYY